MRHPASLGLAAVLSCCLASTACAQQPPDSSFAARRAELVEKHIAPEIEDETVVRALATVPRHLFVPPELVGYAYENRPLPIAEGQTISQPFVVAVMTYLLDVQPGDKVLEIGTGSGYQAAVLAELGADVYSIEILPGVAEQGAANLKAADYDRVHLRVGDGYLGWPEAAPFAGIIVTCAPDHVPAPLEEQLAEGGRLVIPVGEARELQELVLVEKEGGKLTRREVIPVRFVPMTGAAAEEPASAR
ncbi:MAG: protein-L-isoaspartate(D-aspartate) O-methyltransferase [Candidatus Eiseniibacteriota bacterium]